MKKQYIETGVVTGTHGVRGELRVQPWCDTPADLTAYPTLYLDAAGQRRLAVTSARVHKSMVLMKIRGVDSIEQAEALRNQTLYVHRGDLHLAPDQVLVADLIGCTVFDSRTGRELGVVSDVSRTGANDVWHIVQNGTEYLIPAIPPVVDTVDVDAQRVMITPLKGIFDHED